MLRSVSIAIFATIVFATMVLSMRGVVVGDETPPPLPAPGAPAGGGFGEPIVDDDAVPPAPPYVPPTGTPTPLPTPSGTPTGNPAGTSSSSPPPAFPRAPAPTTPPVAPSPTPTPPAVSIPTTNLPTPTMPPATPSSPVLPSSSPSPPTLRSPASSPTSPTSPAFPISLTPETDPQTTPRPPVKIVGEPPASVLLQRPELARSVADPQHPFFGLVGPPRTTDTRIEGTPLTLYTVLQSTRQPLRRLQRITAYWDATESLANYHLRCAFETQLQLWMESLKKSPSRSVETESMLALLVPAQQLAASERRAAEVRFIKQQHRFAEVLSGGEPTDVLPIPCDFPLVKPYDTKLDAIARQRGVSQRARELDAQLPMEHLLLGHCRDATVAAEEMFRIVYERQSSLMDALVALRQVMSARQELVAQTVAYNKMIAEYVTETVSSDASPYRLLSALVELPPVE
ncbi:MAG: hypothetical protein ACRC46_04260 [Thermoguttaceae bacterium]